jgi:hypothetical protein
MLAVFGFVVRHTRVVAPQVKTRAMHTMIIIVNVVQPALDHSDDPTLKNQATQQSPLLRVSQKILRRLEGSLHQPWGNPSQ